MCACAQCGEWDPDGVGCTCERLITCDLCRELEGWTEAADPDDEDPELAGLDPEDDAAAWLRDHEEDAP